MAKLVVLAAVMVAFLALAEASARTVITTTVEEENQGEQCMQQIQQEMEDLQHCQMFMTDVGREFLHFQQCCQGLQNVNDRQCRCEALSQMVQQQVGGSYGPQMMQGMMVKARFLPRMCGLEHECENIQSPFVPRS